MKYLFTFFSLLVTVQFLSAQDPAYPPAPAAPGNIIRVEYFFDTDPGFGNGVNIPVTAATDLPNVLAAVNTSALSNGTHRIYIRTLNAEGKWSISNVQEFIVDFNPAYPPAPAAPGNIIKAEYFFDTDPGFGNGVNIPVTAATDLSNIAATINTAGLSNGTHRIYLRTLNAEGKWSIGQLREFVYDADPVYPPIPAPAGNITVAEYFFDTDPGFGNGTPITITPSMDISSHSFSADVAALSNGNHILYIRSKDDWSITSVTSFTKGSALPLRFLSFSAKKLNAGILLNWTTSDEVNTSRFDIEKSADGLSFSKTGQVTAFNRSGRNGYSFLDGHPLDKMNFYRLKQIDIDGKFTYSSIVSIWIDVSELKFSLSPNPASHFINISYPGKKDLVTITIYDVQGKLLKQQTSKNNVPITIDIRDLKAGMYFIQLNDGETIHSGKFAK